MQAGARDLHTIDEAADVLRCSTRTVHRLIADGTLRTTRVRRRRLVLASSLVEYLEQPTQ